VRWLAGQMELWSPACPATPLAIAVA